VVDERDLLHYGLVSAGGGYAFKRRPDGTYDPADTGMNNPGAIKGSRCWCG